MAIFFIILIVVIAYMVWVSKMKKRIKQQEDEAAQMRYQAEVSNKTTYNKVGYTVIEDKEVQHISGLPGTGEEMCRITIKSKMLYIDGSKHFEIPMERVIGANVSPQIRTIQTYNTTTKNKPSISGAVAGGVLFGAPGAIIGGMSGKSKTTTTVNEQNIVEALYLSIDYANTDGIPQQLIFKGVYNSNLYDLKDKINAYANHMDSVL